MATIFAAGFTVLLVILAVFQLALIAGAPLGRFAWGGQNTRLPSKLRIGSAVSVLVYGLFVYIALARVGTIETPAPGLAIVIAMWVVTAYLFLSVLPNLASKSRPEKLLMVPVSAVIAVLALGIALS